MIRLLIAGLIVVTVVFGLWFVVITDEMVIGMIQNSVADGDMKVEIETFKKGLFFTFTSPHIALTKSGRPLIMMDDVAAQVNPLNLLTGRPPVKFRGDLGGGRINGEIGLFKGGTTDFRLDGANIAEIPFFRLIGLEGRGALSGELKTRGTTGDIKFTVKDTRLRTASFGGVPVPLEIFREAKGAMTLEGPTLSIVSFTMEGEGIYARIRGKIAGKTLNVTLELMPDASFRGEAIMLAALTNYKVSPGYYVIPITKTLAL